MTAPDRRGRLHPRWAGPVRSAWSHEHLKGRTPYQTERPLSYDSGEAPPRVPPDDRLGALLTFYLLRDGNVGWGDVTRHFSGWRREIIDLAGQQAVSMLSAYMISTGVLAAFGAIITADALQGTVGWPEGS